MTNDDDARRSARGLRPDDSGQSDDGATRARNAHDDWNATPPEEGNETPGEYDLAEAAEYIEATEFAWLAPEEAGTFGEG